jgi:hypothetical protein
VVIIVVNSWTGNPVGYLSEEIGNNTLIYQLPPLFSYPCYFLSTHSLSAHFFSAHSFLAHSENDDYIISMISAALPRDDQFRILRTGYCG